MKQVFRENNFRTKRRELLSNIVNIIEEYEGGGYALTVRQVYYQLVARGFIPNEKGEYEKVVEAVKDGRYNGLIDWDSIEDRGRVSQMHSEWGNPAQLLESAMYSYRLRRRQNQPYYIELITEKNALTSVLSPIAEKWHIRFTPFTGYGSTTVLYDLSKRIEKAVDEGKIAILSYLGDHDPSGIDMIRDIKDRLSEFLGVDEFSSPMFEIIHVGLTMEQIKEYDPPPNPVKEDPRATDYIAKFGMMSWEVDALRPDIMHKIVEDKIKEYTDCDKWMKVVKQEEEDMEQVHKLIDEFVKREIREVEKEEILEELDESDIVDETSEEEFFGDD